VATFDVAHRDEFKLLLPNLTFVLAVLLYPVFKYHPLEQIDAEAPGQRPAA
jgi:hypothetical protein